MSTTLYRPYTTLAKVKNECRVSTEEITNDDWFKECINDASREVERITGREFWYFAYTTLAKLTVKPWWVHGNTIYLPWPVITLTGVYLGTDEDQMDTGDYAYTTCDKDGYGAQVFRADGVHWTGYNRTIDEYEGEVVTTQRKDPSKGFLGVNFEMDDYDPTAHVIKMVGTFGYAITEDATVPPASMPQNVTRAATLIAAAFSGYNRREVLSYTGERVSLADSRVPEEAMKLLKAARRLVL